jgi:hypothetical protein
VASFTPPTAAAATSRLDLATGEEEAGEGEVDAASAMPGGRRPRLRPSGLRRRREEKGVGEDGAHPSPTTISAASLVRGATPGWPSRHRGALPTPLPHREEQDVVAILDPLLSVLGGCSPRRAAPRQIYKSRSRPPPGGNREEGAWGRTTGRPCRMERRGGAPPACEENAARRREKRRWLDWRLE